jgi:hypothetical protein
LSGGARGPGRLRTDQLARATPTPSKVSTPSGRDQLQNTLGKLQMALRHGQGDVLTIGCGTLRPGAGS